VINVAYGSGQDSCWGNASGGPRPRSSARTTAKEPDDPLSSTAAAGAPVGS
jgi:hypothetical protein